MLGSSERRRAHLAPSTGPVLLVVVDAEEEFAWDQPFDRINVGTTSIAGQPLMHERVFDRFGIVPTYMCDWPVTTAPASATTLRRLMEDGRCEIGAHLHPWVSPPHVEQITRFNSYAGNLPRELEYEKIHRLTEAIVDSFGHVPLAFKAGRYGLGPHTADTIAALGYAIDTSVVPYTSFAYDSGPDFRDYDEHACWFRAGARELLEVPVTTGYAGWLRALGPQLFELAQHPLALRARVGGILARSRALERIRLSPEVASGAEMRRLAATLANSGCEVFTLTYHSPSMAVGHTPYVRSTADLERFIATVHDFCAWFRDELGGRFSSMSQLWDMVGGGQAQPSAAGQNGARRQMQG